MLRNKGKYKARKQGSTDHEVITGCKATREQLTEHADGRVLMLRSVNQATKGLTGLCLISSGVPSCWILPLHNPRNDEITCPNTQG